jgi:uncharacterized membrane protein YcaP (DUF421 family)
MKPEEIHLGDWGRILIGNVPAAFFIELLIRAAVFYALIIFCMRLLGKRMSSHMSRNELASLVALAAAIGIPLATPDRGILPGVISCMVVVVCARFIAARFTKNETLERITQGYTSELVADGVVKVNSLKESHLSRDRVMAQLRSEGLKHLGKVKRLYFEKNGSFTLIKDPVKTTGLNILPQEDKGYAEQQKKVPGLLVCENCGKTRPVARKICDNCGNATFIEAVSDE